MGPFDSPPMGSCQLPIDTYGLSLTIFELFNWLQKRFQPVHPFANFLAKIDSLVNKMRIYFELYIRTLYVPHSHFINTRFYKTFVRICEKVSNWLFYGTSTAKGHWRQRSVLAVSDHTQDTQRLVGRQKHNK